MVCLTSCCGRGPNLHPVPLPHLRAETPTTRPRRINPPSVDWAKTRTTVTATLSPLREVRWLTVAALAAWVVCAFIAHVLAGWFMVGVAFAVLDWLTKG